MSLILTHIGAAATCGGQHAGSWSRARKPPIGEWLKAMEPP
jgi:hypothetical protein